MDQTIVEKFNQFILKIENGCDTDSFYNLLDDLKKECLKLHGCKGRHKLNYLFHLGGVSSEEEADLALSECIQTTCDSFMLDCKAFSRLVYTLIGLLRYKQIVSAERISRRLNTPNYLTLE